MKNTKLCKSLLFLWIVFLFASCAGLGETKDTKIIVSGNFSGNSNENTARTATSSFSDSVKWTLEAYSIGADGKVDSASKVEGSVKSDLSFTIELPAVGKYQFRAIGKTESQQVFLGLVDENIAESGNDALLIPVSPCSEDDGKIRLSIKDQSSASLKKLVVKEDGSEISTADFNETGLVELNIANLSCGVHRLILSFEDGKGNVLYSCHEAFNVFGGLTTDIWYGSAPYLTKDDSGSYQFIITSDLITKYGAEVLPDTDMMLYNVQYDEYNDVGGYKYYLADNAGQTITSDTQATVTTTSSENSFCFDGNGYYYVIAGKGGSATYIKSNKPDFGSKTLENTIVPGAMYLYGDLGEILTVDRFTNILYMFDGSNDEISQITKDDGEYVYKEENRVYFPAKTFSFSEDSNRGKIDGESVFTVYNGVAYFASLSEGVNLVIADLENAIAGETEGYYNITGSKLVSLVLGEMDLSSVSDEAAITDILYQDGAVYMLLRDVATADTWDKIYSRGALIKYDCLLGTVKTLGWTNTASALSGDKYVYTFYVSGDGYNINYRYNKIGNGGGTGEYDVLLKCSDLGENTPQLYTVSAENEESAFCGPQKFVALKPKKLLIADDGVAFYTDSIGAYKFRNKNRVVTVDLESFAIESVAEAAVSFGTDADAVPSNACTYPNLSSLSTEPPIYIYKDGSHEACGDDITQFYYHASSFTVKSSFFNSGAATYAFPCGDGEEVIDDGE